MNFAGRLFNAPPARKSLYRALLGGFAGFAGYTCFYQFTRYVKLSQEWRQIEDNINKFEPVELKGRQAKYYPWLGEPTLKNWEYKIVKVKGYFKDERFFVRRQRGGKEGYLVFAPFITAQENIEMDDRSNINPPVEFGLFVNLGWVPLENKDDITMGNDPVPLLEPETNPDKFFADYHTGFNPNPENPDENAIFPLTEITGIVRRGEESDFLHGRRNWKNDGVYKYIDLNFMARFFRLFNIDGASTAYLERIVPSFEESEEQLYPIPSTKTIFDRPVVNAANYRNNFFLWGGFSAVGLVSFLTLLR